MANAKERGRLGDILVRELGEYVQALMEAGHDWETFWTAPALPPGSRLWWLHGRFLLARECAGMVDLRFTDSELTQFCRERLAYRELTADRRPEPG